VKKTSTIATQTDYVMSTTTDASMQYNYEDITTEYKATSEPSSENVDGLDKTILTALLQLYTIIGSSN